MKVGGRRRNGCTAVSCSSKTDIIKPVMRTETAGFDCYTVLFALCVLKAQNRMRVDGVPATNELKTFLPKLPERNSLIYAALNSV